MTALKVGSKSFERSYRERSLYLLELAKSLPDRPNASDIHDLRVTARRIQVMRTLLPRSIAASPNSRRFELALKSVLKATSQLRDLDTLLVTLQPYRGSLPGDALERLRNQRSDAAARAKLTTKVLVDVPSPDIEPDVKGKKLSKRLRKNVLKRGRTVVSLLSEVLEEESQVAELHSLRKEVKKARYLLELADDPPKELDLLTEWQAALGLVHDIDVALDFVRQSSSESKGRVLSQLERARHLAYLKFVSEYKTDSMESLGRSKVLAGAPMLPAY